MPVNRSTSTRRQLPDGTVVTTTVREGTRRRRGEVNRYLLGPKNYSTTTTRTRSPDGTVVTTRGDTHAGVKAAAVIILVVAGAIAAIFAGGDGSHSNANGRVIPVAGPPAPSAGYSVLIYSLDTAKAGEQVSYDDKVNLRGGAVEVCYDAPPGPLGVNNDVILGDYNGDLEAFMSNPGRACDQLASSEDVSGLLPDNPTPIYVEDTGQPFMVNVWEQSTE
ncbi:MAG: hypothetical protein ABSA91_19980 [Acidimicrobiales bacterium]